MTQSFGAVCLRLFGLLALGLWVQRGAKLPISFQGHKGRVRRGPESPSHSQAIPAPKGSKGLPQGPFSKRFIHSHCHSEAQTFSHVRCRCSKFKLQPKKPRPSTTGSHSAQSSLYYSQLGGDTGVLWSAALATV